MCASWSNTTGEAKRRAPSDSNTGEALLTTRRTGVVGLTAVTSPMAFRLGRSGSRLSHWRRGPIRVVRQGAERQTIPHRFQGHHGDPGANAPQHDSPTGLLEAVVRAGCRPGMTVPATAAVPQLDQLRLVRAAWLALNPVRAELPPRSGRQPTGDLRVPNTAERSTPPPRFLGRADDPAVRWPGSWPSTSRRFAWASCRAWGKNARSIHQETRRLAPAGTGDPAALSRRRESSGPP